MSLGPGHFGDDGAQRVIDMAGRLGIDSTKLSAVPSLTLGTSDTNVLDMAEAYSVFANEGIHRTPNFITKIVGPDGKVVYQADTSGTRVISEQNARTETQILTGVITNGTGTRAKTRSARGRQDGHDRPTTRTRGSSATRRSTPPRCGWASFEGTSGANQMRNVGGIAVTGGSYPARIWAAFMSGASKDLPVMQFTPPDEQAVAGRPEDRRVRPVGRPPDSHRARTAPVRATATTAPNGAGPIVDAPPVTEAPTTPDTDTDRTGHAGTVSAEELERLLVVQEHDLALDRLRHRRGDAARARRARGEHAGARHAWAGSSTSSGRSATPCAPRRSGSTTKPRPSGRAPPRSTRSCTPAP